MKAVAFPAIVPKDVMAVAKHAPTVAEAVTALREADRYSLALCLLGDPFAGPASDWADTRQEAAEAIAKKLFRLDEFRQGVLEKFPDDDRNDGRDGVLFPFAHAYRDAGYYLGVAVGLRMARMLDGSAR